MKTKLVYVLVSNKNDFYLEQALLSVYSARLHNSDAHITLITDTGTVETCSDGLRKDFLGYFDEIKVLDVSQHKANVARSRELKTNVRNLVDGDYLYIDCDTIICESLSDADTFKGPIAMCADRHLRKDDWHYFALERDRKQNIGDTSMPVHFNAGIMYVKDCDVTHRLFKCWNEEWNTNYKTGIVSDQPPFYKALKRCPVDIEEIDGIWNCQIMSNSLPYLHRAKIIHTFISDSSERIYLLAQNQYLQQVREDNGISPSTKLLIDNARGAFVPLNVIVGKDTISFINSKLYTRANYFRKNSKAMYCILDKFSLMLNVTYALAHNFGSTVRLIKRRLISR